MIRRRFPYRSLAGSAAALFLLVAFGCGGKAAPDAAASGPAATPAAGEAPFPPADAGRIEGVVAYSGPDDDAPLPLSADPTCAKLHPGPLESETIVGDGAGHLGNVFVYVKAGLPPRTYPSPTEKIEVDQSGCTYLPHVVGVRTGQTVVIKNSDATIHNVYAQASTNPQFNRGLPQAGMSFEKTFDHPEVMVTLHCNVHPWMAAHVGVLDHPYFAVTGPDGKFEIQDLPPGTYTLEAWHEKLGRKEMVVTVAKGGAETLTVDYGAGGEEVGRPAN